MTLFVPDEDLELPDAVAMVARWRHKERFQASEISGEEEEFLARHKAAVDRIAHAVTQRSAPSLGNLAALGSGGYSLGSEYIGDIPGEVFEDATSSEQLESIIRRKRDRSDILSTSWSHLRNLLYKEELSGYVFVIATGKTRDAPSHIWGAPVFNNAQEYLKAPKILLDGEEVLVRGRVKATELEAVLDGRPARPAPDPLPEKDEEPSSISKPARGRKPKAGIDEFWIEVCRLQANEDIPNLTGYVEAMCQWSIDNMKAPYEADTVRKKLGVWWKSMGWD